MLYKKIINRIKRNKTINLLLLYFVVGCSRFIKHNHKYAYFDTSKDSHNLGDYIIMDYCAKQLSVIGNAIDNYPISTHKIPSLTERKYFSHFKGKILCGTNILEGTMATSWLWQLPFFKLGYSDIILLGVGWNRDNNLPDRYTGLFYKCILDPKAIHSVRDSYTEKMLRSVGINNVVNTACPTMWDLTPEHCSEIPMEKQSRVITTLTDYARDYELDSYLLTTLLENYDSVYLWIQGTEDLEYFDSLKIKNKDHIIIVENTLAAYDEVLQMQDLEYVGTRLHGGIRALNNKKRTIIIAVDNRAREIGRDTNLNVIMRSDIKDQLLSRIQSRFCTEIKLPWENIEKWKRQFCD